MKRYEITTKIIMYDAVEVDAMDEDEATELAFEELTNIYGQDAEIEIIDMDVVAKSH